MGPQPASLKMSQRRIYRPLSKKGLFSGTLRMARQEIFAFISVLALLILGLWTSYEILNISRDIKCLRIEQDRLVAQNQDLRSQEVRLKSVSHMQRLGRRLGLHPPTDSQIVYLK